MSAANDAPDAPLFDPGAFRIAAEDAALIERARAFGARVLAPRAAKHDRDATFPIENFRDMHGEGLLAICVPKRDGGLVPSFATYCIAAAELGRYCGATALSWNMHVCSTLWTGALADDLKMTAEERASHAARRSLHYRRIVADGALYSAAILRRGRCGRGRRRVRHRSEARRRRLCSSTARKSLPRSRARPITMACSAPSAVKAKPQAGAIRSTSRSAAKAPGVAVSGPWDPLGMRGTVSRTLTFTDVFVPEEEMLMPHGVYFRAATSWPHMFLTLSPTYMGLAQAAYDFTVRYLRGELPGTPPVKRRMFPTKQIAVAEMRIMLEQTKAIWFQAITEARANPTRDQVLRAYAAQYSVMENANALAAKAIRTCGGQSMLKDLALERIYRDSRCGSARSAVDRGVSSSTGSAANASTRRARRTNDVDLSDLIDRNASFTPDKPAICFAGAALNYAGLAGRIANAARALKSGLGVGHGDRVAILAANHPDYLVLLYACARLGAMLCRSTRRLAVPEQIYILCDASVRRCRRANLCRRDRAAQDGAA